MAARRRSLVANWDTLQRVFIRPEDDTARRTLLKYMEQILFGLHDFLRDHVGITQAVSLKDLARGYRDSRIPDEPERRLAEVLQGLVEDVAPCAVNVASPYFVGHMTSAIPFFMVHLQTLAAALHQNPVKLETSKVVAVHERQVLAKLHRLVFRRSPGFYRRHIQRPESTLGCFVADGTLANLTALWVARNRCLPPRPGFAGVEAEGMAAALAAHGVARMAVLVSERGHFSLRKACGVLGIGHAQVIPVPVDRRQRLDAAALARLLERHHAPARGLRVMAVVGIAGTTETGSVDPLPAIAVLCARHGVHFHVDAAWGGPTLMSDAYAPLLDGIQQADSVTIDGHKQLYMPMGCGMVFFRDPASMDAVAYHAAYVNRPGSADLGIRHLEGSRPAASLVLGGALAIMGRRGYAVLIEHGIDTARRFAAAIARRPLFQVTTAPQLNILTYRLVPPHLRAGLQSTDPETRRSANAAVNRLTVALQRRQRESGRSFVSRTTLNLPGLGDTVVLRAVIMNPMTTPEVLEAILDEQEALWRAEDAAAPPGP
jgi:glutamate decarboxylase